AGTPSQGSFNPANDTWTVGTLPNGASASLPVAVQVATVGPVVNTARVSADQFDLNQSTVQASATLVGVAPTVAPSKSLLLASTNIGLPPLPPAQPAVFAAPAVGADALSSVPIAGHSVLFALGADQGIWRWDPTTHPTWTEVSTATGQQFVQLSAGTDGQGQADVYAVTTTGALWKFDSQFAPQGFQVDAPGMVQQVSATQDNWAIVLGSDGQIYSYNGLGFGAGARYRMTNNSGATYLAVSAGNDQAGRISIFAITSGNALVRVQADGTTARLSGAELIRQVSAGQDSQGNVDAYAVSTAGALFKYDSLNGYFQVDSSGNLQQVSAALADWGIVLDASQALYSYNGQGQGQGKRFLLESPGSAAALTADTDGSGLNVFYVTPIGSIFQIRPDGTLVSLSA
ncbi:MAG: hypothetical protein JO112_07305, partial [Planctomycetes bacterium]|nr:hypothetical protein [Planctomycetota bacterium]